jgi:hypothetical protein
LHLSVPTPGGPTGILGPVVQISAFPVFNIGKQLMLRHTVAAQPVSDENAGHILQALRQAPDETLCCFGIAVALHQDIEYDPILVNGAPQESAARPGSVAKFTFEWPFVTLCIPNSERKQTLQQNPQCSHALMAPSERPCFETSLPTNLWRAHHGAFSFVRTSIYAR